MFSLIKQWKLTDLTVKNIVSTDDSVKRQITDLISENLTDLDLESRDQKERTKIQKAMNSQNDPSIFFSKFTR